jgi:hypothetical protein
MVQLLRMPPPPQLVQFPELNRWLQDLQSFIAQSGGIDPSSIPGYSALQTQVSTNTANIGTLSGTVSSLSTTVATHTTQISSLNSQVSTNTSNIATNTANIATLTARNQVLNGSGAPGAGLGNNGDLYLNNTGGAGTRLYGKIGGVWVVIA